jgi:diacylglycerol kinase family enzyme
VLLNSSAGTAAGKERDDLRAELEAAFRKHEVSASFEFVPGSKLRAAAERAVQRAAAGQIDAIVAGGGDGTIHTVASAVAGTDIPLGIIALGTLNHFAKDLKIPLLIDDAVAVIAGGAHRSVDVGEVNGEIFINNSSIGIYPYVVLDRERRRKRLGWSKWTAMIIAGFRAFWSLRLRRLRIRAQNWQEACRSPCVFVGNNEYHLKGSSFGSRERLDGGELCLFVAREQSRLALLWLAVRCVAGLVDQRDLRIFAVPAVEISSRRKRLLVAFDGEIRWMQTPLHYRIRPAALRVLAPLPAQQ